MDQGMLIDAIVRQTTVLIAQLATAGGGRAQLSHTANQVFLDLVGALKEQGLGTKVIADMFGMALRTYQTKVQRLSESRTERGRSLWEALFAFIQEHGATRPVARGELLRRFSHDDALSVGGVLRDLVDSGLVYRSGRGDHAQYRTADASFAPDAFSAEERAQSFVWLTVHRLAPVTRDQLVDALSMESSLVDAALAKLLEDGRIRRSEQDRERYESDGCVLPLGEPAGWEAALFDHYQAMVMAICTKLQLGRNQARASDLIGGSTFSFRVWPDHPHYQEATGFLAGFRAEGAALRKKIAVYNEAHPERETDAQRVLIYAGQTVIDLAETVEEES